MEEVKIIIDGIEKNVYGLLYVYESKYYFIYTEKELDPNNYVILYMSQVGKETKNTETGVIDTGYMIGIEVSDPEEQKKVQTSISYIVEDKKNNTINSKIQYLPISVLSNLKILGKKRFRLLKSIIEENFDLDLSNSENNIAIINNETQGEVEQQVQLQNQAVEDNDSLNKSSGLVSENDIGNNIIIDYRTKYFEEEEKNKELQNQIDLLTQKINEIKKIVE